MPRQGRIVVPGLPHHIVHRGHNRRPLFITPTDFEVYLGNLAEWRGACGVSVFAYCLMTNHVHLLLCPSTAAGLARLMRKLGTALTRNRNLRSGTTGTRWEGRYRSSVVDNDSYLLACVRYIELNPVRAGIVSDPASYEWSSLRWRTGLAESSLLEPDPAYLGLGATDPERRQAYASFLADVIAAEETTLIRDALRRGRLTGGVEFGGQIARRTGRVVENRGPGRPKKIASVPFLPEQMLS